MHNVDCFDNDTVRRSYACAVSGVDDGVGAIMDALAASGMEENTLVVFTADHGLCGGHHGMWGMGDHSRPMHMFQENMRVPLIFRHPAQMPAGGVFETMNCNYDFLPSVLSYLDLPLPCTDAAPLPGRSYAEALCGGEPAWGRENVFHEYENTRSVQTPRWKLVLRRPEGPNELYDLDRDPTEQANLYDAPEHESVRCELAEELRGFFNRHSDPQYDLWGSGRSKAGQ